MHLGPWAPLQQSTSPLPRSSFAREDSSSLIEFPAPAKPRRLILLTSLTANWSRRIRPRICCSKTRVSSRTAKNFAAGRSEVLMLCKDSADEERPWTMATTTVTGHGRRASMRQAELQAPSKAPASTSTSTTQSTSSPLDQFPPYEETLDAAIGPGRPNRSPSVKYMSNEKWEPRKSAYYPRDATNGPLRTSKHRPRKSISEAITTIRTRNGSVSANAQELAEALRAPVSYRLTVG